MRRFKPAFAPVLVLLSLLCACGTRPAPAPSGSSPPPPAAASSRPTLAAEQVRLAALFRGTPVVFGMQQDGSLRVTVPLRFSFEAGAVKVKPPLAAVLDRLAKSQLQTDSRLRVAAPADPQARGGALARDRAFSVRDHLVGQGIAEARLQTAGAAQADQVEIVVSDAAR